MEHGELQDRSPTGNAEANTGERERLRVAFVAGTLAIGGAEKQLVYMVRSLLETNVDVRVYTAEQGGGFERPLTDLGCPVIWFGRRRSVPARLLHLTRSLRRFRPHVLQASHFYTNLYVAMAAPVVGSLGLGSLRNDAIHEVAKNGRWGPWLLRGPRSLIANSHLAKANAIELGIDADRIFVVSNVIDLDAFDRDLERSAAELQTDTTPTLIAIGRLVAAKKFDQLIEALCLVKQQVPVRAILLGDGPLRSDLQALAARKNLTSDELRFLGWRKEIPSLISQADMLVSTSSHEGFPNVVLESMAAGIPAIATPAGDVGRVIQDGRTGFLVPFDDVRQLADRIVQLARDPVLRRSLGGAARQQAVRQFTPVQLADRLMTTYRDASRRQGKALIEPLLAVP